MKVQFKACTFNRHDCIVQLGMRISSAVSRACTNLAKKMGDKSSAELHADRAWELWRAIGSPKWVCAPMVDGSELAFRDLCRRYGVHLCYTPMINSKLFVQSDTFRDNYFTTHPQDRPLAAQFAADDPDTFVAAAKLLQDHVDAVDLNLGCPQNIAKRGHYGSFLQDEWELIASIVKAAAEQLTVPVWCKIRIFPSLEKSVAYAKMIEAAGASVLCVHGRTRDQKGKFCPPADLAVVRAIKKALSIPVIANGNVLSLHDARVALETSEADAVMSAFALLDNPANFFEAPEGTELPSRLELAREYLDLAEKHETSMKMVRLHMFKFLRSRLDVNMDLNSAVAGCRTIPEFRGMCDVLEGRCDADGISFEKRVASGNTPRNVMAPKTILRMQKAAAAAAAAAAEEAKGDGGGTEVGNGGGDASLGGSAAGVENAMKRAKLAASAGSGAYVGLNHALVKSGNLAHSALHASSSGPGDSNVADGVKVDGDANTAASGLKRKAATSPS